MRIGFNNDWKFTTKFSEEIICNDYDDSNMNTVRIPHTVCETPLNYFDEDTYKMLSGYRKTFSYSSMWAGQRVILHFGAVAHTCRVYVNEQMAAHHECGYTAFDIDITDYLYKDKENVVALAVDSRESQNVPPFGNVIDYMTYGGIYREVYLDIRSSAYISDIFVKPIITDETYVFDDARNNASASLASDITINLINNNLCLEDITVLQEIVSKNPLEVIYKETTLLDNADKKQNGKATMSLEADLPRVKVWDINSPSLYELRISLVVNNEIIDSSCTCFGFRKEIFKADGFYLNGRKVKILGLNRHQSYPYVGYAMPKSMQELDADILKNELHVNAVRTSHYPQSQSFIDRCDEIGLLVFTEMPGWQHIGDDDWKEQALNNLEEMILQYRNHPSIILWGVRINESVDDDSFYKKTNELAHRLDDTRQTGGVRVIDKSHLFEDVYTFNDFSHNGKRKGCRNKASVTSNNDKAYFISEYNGHMFPTKAFDNEDRRTEHAIRYANVIDCVNSNSDIAGSFGWCMFDYNTHKDFGSGDRICYHGVMDMFRNPKLASFVFKSQSNDEDVLEISSGMDIGEHSESVRGDVWIFTNADSVKMFINDSFIKEYYTKDSPYKNLAHGPIRIDDYVGDRIMEGEHFDSKKSKIISGLMNEVAIRGVGSLRIADYLKAGLSCIRYHMSMDGFIDLYNRYLVSWGGKSNTFRFEAYKDGKLVKTMEKSPAKNLKLFAKASSVKLHETSTYDVSEIRMNALDENGNPAPFLFEPVKLVTSGPIEIIGPDTVSFIGGMTGTYIRTTGAEGRASLTISTSFAKDITIDFSVSKEG